MERIELPDGAWLLHDPTWLEAQAASALQAELTETVAWEQRDIVVFGKPVPQPRLVGWAGELPYKYSGQTLEPRPAPPALAAIVARICEAVDVPFNHVLLNRYRDGHDKMGRHADNEPELGRNPVIAALSLGVARRFVLERKKNQQKKKVSLVHGSLFVMAGACQHTWRHAVPAMPSTTGERINLTVRYLKGPPGWREPRSRRA